MIQLIVALNPCAPSLILFLGVTVDWCSNLRVGLSPNCSSCTLGVCFSSICFIFFNSYASWRSIDGRELWCADWTWVALFELNLVLTWTSKIVLLSPLPAKLSLNTPKLALLLIWFYNVLNVETTLRALAIFICFLVLIYRFDLTRRLSLSIPETEFTLWFEKVLAMLFLESFAGNILTLTVTPGVFTEYDDRLFAGLRVLLSLFRFIVYSLFASKPISCLWSIYSF